MSKDYKYNHFDVIDNVSILDVANKYLTLKQQGVHHTSICPFCGAKEGRFFITESKKQYKCYSCDRSRGNVINLLAYFKGISYVEAMMDLGVSYGIFLDSGHKPTLENSRELKRRREENERIRREEEEERIRNTATNEELNLIYSTFLNLMDLSPKHRDDLVNKRKLTIKQIEEGEYRTYPNVELIHKLLEEMDRQGIPKDLLKKIPGFYKRVETNDWKFPWGSGLIIPIRNHKGQIVALQTRLDGKGIENKYRWFSSAGKNSSDKFKYGSSSGAPLDISYPSRVCCKALLITEGRFKAEKVSEKLNLPAISVQGVGNFNGIIETIKEMEMEISKRYNIENFKFLNINIAYDADFRHKEGVLNHAKNLMKDIHEELRIEPIYISWDEKLGKGIDDVINSQDNVTSKFNKISMDEFASISVEENKKHIKKYRKEHLFNQPQQIISGTEIDVDELRRRSINRMYGTVA